MMTSQPLNVYLTSLYADISLRLAKQKLTVPFRIDLRAARCLLIPEAGQFWHRSAWAVAARGTRTRRRRPAAPGPRGRPRSRYSPACGFPRGALARHEGSRPGDQTARAGARRHRARARELCRIIDMAISVQHDEFSPLGNRPAWQRPRARSSLPRFYRGNEAGVNTTSVVLADGRRGGGASRCPG